MYWFPIGHIRDDPQVGLRLSGVVGPYPRKPALTDFTWAIRRPARTQSCRGSATIRASPRRERAWEALRSAEGGAHLGRSATRCCLDSRRPRAVLAGRKGS